MIFQKGAQDHDKKHQYSSAYSILEDTALSRSPNTIYTLNGDIICRGCSCSTSKALHKVRTCKCVRVYCYASSFFRYNKNVFDYYDKTELTDALTKTSRQWCGGKFLYACLRFEREVASRSKESRDAFVERQGASILLLVTLYV